MNDGKGTQEKEGKREKRDQEIEVRNCFPVILGSMGWLQYSEQTERMLCIGRARH
jgi:hypothetical protein